MALTTDLFLTLNLSSQNLPVMFLLEELVEEYNQKISEAAPRLIFLNEDPKFWKFIQSVATVCKLECIQSRKKYSFDDVTFSKEIHHVDANKIEIRCTPMSAVPHWMKNINSKQIPSKLKSCVQQKQTLNELRVRSCSNNIESPDSIETDEAMPARELINKAGEDVWLHILSMLSPFELGSISCVSKLWRQLSNNDKLWKNWCFYFDVIMRPRSSSWKEFFVKTVLQKNKGSICNFHGGIFPKHIHL
eukprot:TRINITY_DN9527_c0_g1_i1.p1 TRINITY_DN9527_c0_g1~~TRINITY_DN9527_c0_g1_i1.p1  ORF type:complete len:247 (-),score=18.21 TRINITY_DN9527_c0_g1_i1:9-749(-)